MLASLIDKESSNSLRDAGVHAFTFRVSFRVKSKLLVLLKRLKLKEDLNVGVSSKPSLFMLYQYSKNIKLASGQDIVIRDDQTSQPKLLIT